MKLSQATEQDKIKALAELDGWKPVAAHGYTTIWFGRWREGEVNPHQTTMSLPDYLTSYDAILPLVKKCWIAGGMDWTAKFERVMEHFIGEPVCVIEAVCDLSPSQLSDALLVATGKFELCHKTMKTAEEWQYEIGSFMSDNIRPELAIKGDFSLHPERVSVMTAKDIQQIQLDAMKEGMRRAGEIVMYERSQGHSVVDCQKAVFTKAHNLTIEEL